MLVLHDAARLDAAASDVVAGRARIGEPILVPRLLRRTPDLAYSGVVHECVAAWVDAGHSVRALDTRASEIMRAQRASNGSSTSRGVSSGSASDQTRRQPL